MSTIIIKMYHVVKQLVDEMFDETKSNIKSMDKTNLVHCPELSRLPIWHVDDTWIPFKKCHI